MKKNLSFSLLMLSLGLCLWILYIFQEEMADYGIYTLISYSTHEIMSVIPLGCTLITVIWLMVTVVKTKKKKLWKENIAVILLLAVAWGLQVGYNVAASNRTSATAIAAVESIEEKKSEVVIRTSEERVVLECPMTIYELLETDRKYLITYEFDQDTPARGKMCLAQLIEQ